MERSDSLKIVLYNEQEEFLKNNIIELNNNFYLPELDTLYIRLSEPTREHNSLDGSSFSTEKEYLQNFIEYYFKFYTITFSKLGLKNLHVECSNKKSVTRDLQFSLGIQNVGINSNFDKSNTNNSSYEYSVKFPIKKSNLNTIIHHKQISKVDRINLLKKYCEDHSKFLFPLITSKDFLSIYLLRINENLNNLSIKHTINIEKSFGIGASLDLNLQITNINIGGHFKKIDTKDLYFNFIFDFYNTNDLMPGIPEIQNANELINKDYTISESASYLKNYNNTKDITIENESNTICLKSTKISSTDCNNQIFAKLVDKIIPLTINQLNSSNIIFDNKITPMQKKCILNKKTNNDIYNSSKNIGYYGPGPWPTNCIRQNKTNLKHYKKLREAEKDAFEIIMKDPINTIIEIVANLSWKNGYSYLINVFKVIETECSFKIGNGYRFIYFHQTKFRDATKIIKTLEDVKYSKND